MKEKPRFIPKNTIVLLTQGEYSDFCVQDLYRAAQNIDVSALQKEFSAEEEVNKDFAYNNIDVFCSWLLKKEYFTQVEHSALYLGSYGELSL